MVDIEIIREWLTKADEDFEFALVNLKEVIRMSQVMLKSPRGEAIEPLVVAALEAEKNEILTAIIKTKQKLSIFEKTFNVSTSDFVTRDHKEIPQISEMDAIEWSGEHETLKRLQEKLSRLQEIEVCT